MNEMLAFLQNHGGAIALLVSLGSAVIAMRFVTREQHEKAVSTLDSKFTLALDKIDKAEDRIAKLENDFGHLPDRNSVHRMELALTELRGELKTVGEQLRPVAAISERLQEFLLEQAKR